VEDLETRDTVGLRIRKHKLEGLFNSYFLEKSLLLTFVEVLLSVMYDYTGWFFSTGPPEFQYQNEKTCSANEELFYIENFVKN